MRRIIFIRKEEGVEDVMKVLRATAHEALQCLRYFMFDSFYSLPLNYYMQNSTKKPEDLGKFFRM